MPRYRTYHNNLNYGSTESNRSRLNMDSPIPLLLLVPTYAIKLGVTTVTYPSVEDALKVLNDDGTKKYVFYGSFKTYGGTETYSDDLWVVKDTAVIETWYRPDIKSDCRVCVLANEAIYDIVNQPEDIQMRDQFMKFKVMRLKGGA